MGRIGDKGANKPLNNPYRHRRDRGQEMVRTKQSLGQKLEANSACPKLSGGFFLGFGVLSTMRSKECFQTDIFDG